MVTMYIDKVPNRNSPPFILLRKAWREGRKIKKKTLDNLSKWPPDKVESLRRVLRGETLVPVGEAFAVERSLPHGQVEAVLRTIGKLGLDRLIASKRCRERDLVVAMVAEQLIHPCSKLATTRLWHTTTLAEELNVEDADEDELYQAMDWLLRRQGRIEKKLANRHISQGSLVLYDVTSSYYEGRTCPLVRFGYDRDGKKGSPVIVASGHARWRIQIQAFNKLCTFRHFDHIFKHDPNAILGFLLTLALAFNLFHTFWALNLKPQLRQRYTKTHWAQMIEATFPVLFDPQPSPPRP